MKVLIVALLVLAAPVFVVSGAAEARPDPPQCGTFVPCCDLPLCLNPDDPCRLVLNREWC